MGELAAICYVDLCRAATYVSRNDMSIIQNITPDVEADLVEKLFDPQRPVDSNALSNNIGVYIDHQRLMADCIVAMYRLDPEKALISLIPTCFEDNAPISFKLGVVKAVVAIASEEYRLPWIPFTSSLYAPLCTRIRKLFLECYNGGSKDKSDTSSQHSSQYSPISARRGLTGSIDKRSNKKDIWTATESDRFELILDILRLYQIDPLLAILVK